MEQIAFPLAPIVTTIAALIVASNLGTGITSFGFIAFTVGSVCRALLEPDHWPAR
jgi:hypothetical protein